MNDAEAEDLAQQCLRAYLACDLTAAPFSSEMRRGLEIASQGANDSDSLKVDEVQWQSYRLRARKTFSDLEGFVHEFKARETAVLELTGVDKAGAVCNFAVFPDLVSSIPNDAPIRSERQSPWMYTAMLSTYQKTAPLLPGIQIGFSRNRLTSDAICHIKVPIESWEALSESQRVSIVDQLERVALSGYRLCSEEVARRLHVVVIRSRDIPGQ